MALLKKKLAFAFAISLMLVACGDDDSSSGVNKSVGKISDADIEEATYDDLPACKSTNKDKSAYVVDEALTYVCDGKKWVSEEKIDSKSSSKEKSSSSVEEKISSSSVEQKRLIQSSSSEEESSSSSEEVVFSSGIEISTLCLVRGVEDTIYYRDIMRTIIRVEGKHSISFERYFRQNHLYEISEGECARVYGNDLVRPCFIQDDPQPQPCMIDDQECVISATLYSPTTDTIVISDYLTLSDFHDVPGERIYVNADLSIDTLSIIKITGSCEYDVTRRTGYETTPCKDHIRTTFEYTSFDCKLHCREGVVPCD